MNMIQASVNAILFQMHTLVTLFGEDDAVEIMKTSPNKEAFERGISRHQHTFSEGGYQIIRALLMSENQSLVETAVASQVVWSREALGEFIECAKRGCSNEGSKQCSICKIVAYHCSKECQVSEWKSHKKVCKKTMFVLKTHQTKPSNLPGQLQVLL